MRNYFLLLLLGLMTLSLMESCKQSVATSSNNNREPEAAAPETNPEMLAVLYQQTAAEYRALCYQAFNVARYQLELKLKETHGMKTYSVIVDIDETMLDNSPYEAKCIVDDMSYPDGWDDWMKSASARAVPGALDFLKYVQSRGVQVFYVSNRDEKYSKQTLQNLQSLGFPFAQSDHLYLKTEERSKLPRRARIANATNVVMLIGDNLMDFSEMFENVNSDERCQITDRFSEKFGAEFIILPNAMYGDWLNSIYNYEKGLDDEVKAEMQKNALRLN